MNWYKISQEEKEESIILWELETMILSNSIQNSIRDNKPLNVGVQVMEMSDPWTQGRLVSPEKQYQVWVNLNPEFVKENLNDGNYIKSSIIMVTRMADVEPLYPLDSDLENKLWNQILLSPINNVHGRPVLGARTLHMMLLTE